MAEVTSNYKLKKPSDDDFYNVQDFNDNADIVDGELKNQSYRMASIENPNFVEADNDNNIQSKESFVGILGKIKRAITRLTDHINSSNPHSGSAPKTHKHSTDDIESGTLPLSRGGTGANTAAGALKNLGITVSSSLINHLSGLTSNVQTQLNSKAPSIHKHDASDTTSGTFSVSRIPNLAISKITNLQESLNGKQNNLGFTPVQQGGGTDMATNKIYIGWTGSKLKAQVDETDMGDIVTTGSANNTELPMSKVEDLPELVLTVMGLTAQFLSYRKSLKIEPNGGVRNVYFKKGSCGFLSSVFNNSPTQVGLWHFSSGSNAVSVVPVIPNSNYEVTGSFLDDEIELTIKNNLTTKEQRFAAILIFNPEFTD